jgi:hypothetical protein
MTSPVPLWVIEKRRNIEAEVEESEPMTMADALRAKDRIVMDDWEFSKEGRVMKWRSVSGAWLAIRPTEG